MYSVGFDLDLTLADTRAGIAAAFDELSQRLGVVIDSDLVISRLGPPLEHELTYWLPPEEIAAAADLYRSLYAVTAVPLTTLMAGAAEAVAEVRRHGGRVIVVTAKNTRDARSTVEALGLEVDEVAGLVFGAGKGMAIADFGAAVYVGDHVADIEAARAGGALSVAVATGPYTEQALRDHGADVVLPDLTGFAAWFEAWRAREIGGVSTVI
ncbi:HAD hydrolase-like protein [Sphaerisporangium sp. TRM90804]|uniref:HAD family hydrolase n=1 Tax=Sphaerisporangium sp. TRM90804 TaxID=3031113 RepID=UPI0024487067|nr:HAD hydrolase-like protein [Sphaerisporangium sp. TRM90804]MDH2430406.1 HAD hydrolase-like protein [Sphaerisporangium sp. TRM90804]